MSKLTAHTCRLASQATLAGKMEGVEPVAFTFACKEQSLDNDASGLPILINVELVLMEEGSETAGQIYRIRPFATIYNLPELSSIAISSEYPNAASVANPPSPVAPG